MRAEGHAGDFKVKVIAGTHTVLIAIDCPEPRRNGLLGFAIKREGPAGTASKWLRSLKVFKSVVPLPDPGQRYSCREHPVQSFLWGDYTAVPGTRYKFVIVPMYGQPGALLPEAGIEVEVETEEEIDGDHGVWFNRGSIASQAFAREFGNKAPSAPDDPADRETAWLSRGLLEACLRFIDDTPAGDGLRVAAYEFTYRPVLLALKAALERGVDVRIVYHADDSKANDDAIRAAKLPRTHNGQKVLYRRTKPKIPHNKYIVRLAANGAPTEVWTGSTNFTASGFLGQSNVGHRVRDAQTTAQYLEFWTVLAKDPELDKAREKVMALTPYPPALVPADSITRIFSPRPRSKMLDWYGDRIEDATGGVMFTAAFGVTKKLVGPLAKDRDFLRFILMEKPPSKAVKAKLSKDRDLVISYGAVLGEMYRFKNGNPVARQRIAEFDLDKWFLKEAHFRRIGHIFFVHTKFLLIDPLSDDPLVCTGSANFSPDSLLQNDENMLIIRGSTRVADIYLTEFDRVFRHFYFRDVANELAARGGKADAPFLAETSAWTDSYFKPGAFKTRRREMFFSTPARTWARNAAARP